jgi:hypothetical protein
LKKLLVLVVLAAAGFFGYKQVFAGSEAYRAYERFADALLYDHWEEARKLAHGDDVLGLVSDSERTAKTGGESYRLIRGTVHGSPYRTVESETASADGKTVTLKVVQEERRGPATMAPVGPPTLRHRQKVEMLLTSDGWEVESFDEEVDRISER